MMTDKSRWDKIGCFHLEIRRILTILKNMNLFRTRAPPYKCSNIASVWQYTTPGSEAVTEPKNLT